MELYFSSLGDMEEIVAAYDEKFPTEPVKLVSTSRGHMLELSGPTLAFKDMALSVLPGLIAKAAAHSDKKVIILTATSGDTGKAALEGFAFVKNTEIFVFFPDKGVSAIQRLQMVTQEGDNVHVYPIRGNFDQAQRGVKNLFTDKNLQKQMEKEKKILTSANSINIGRLIPQIAYYVYGYLQLVKREKIHFGEQIHVSVPTGNFGNILAAYYAKRMGLPIHTLICVSNDNRVLTDFFETSKYDANRELILLPPLHGYFDF